MDEGMDDDVRLPPSGGLPDVSGGAVVVESEVDQCSHVGDGGAGDDPGVVLAAVAIAESAVAVGDEPGHGAFDGRSPSSVGGLSLGVGGGLVAGGGEQVAVWANGDDPAGLGVVPRSRWGSAGALVGEERFALHVPPGRRRAGRRSRRAGHGAARGVAGEVLQTEPAAGRRSSADRASHTPPLFLTGCQLDRLQRGPLTGEDGEVRRSTSYPSRTS